LRQYEHKTQVSDSNKNDLDARFNNEPRAHSLKTIRPSDKYPKRQMHYALAVFLPHSCGNNIALYSPQKKVAQNNKKAQKT
jgi:hypothetical protein